MELKLSRERDTYQDLENRRARALDNLDMEEIQRIAEEVQRNLEDSPDDERFTQLLMQCSLDLRDLSIFWGDFSS